MQKKQGDTLSDRVSWLLDRVWGGNLSKAALDLGVPQPSLHRLARGDVQSPRTAVLATVAEGCDVSLDWLLGGVGTEPTLLDRNGRPVVAGLPRWRRAVRRLDLGPPILDEVLELPYGVWYASQALRSQAAEPSPDLGLVALSGSLNAWALLLEAQVGRKPRGPGPHALQVRLQHHRLLLRLGFSAAGRAIAKNPKLRDQVAQGLDVKRG